jgi:esterase FrsA
MVRTGPPEQDASAVRAAVKEMWPDAPRGRVYEWSALARRDADAGQHELAVLAYGWAKLPALADEPKRAAFARQSEQHLLASAGLPVRLERRVLDLPYQAGATPVPIHLLWAPPLAADAPVLLASGGVDSWKTDLHQLFVALALNTGARVLAFDIPGTGESQVPLTPESTEVIDGPIETARALGNGAVGHLGISMGGYFSAYSGLAKSVDAAVVLGGPVQAAFAPDRTWAFGMADIVGNAAGHAETPPAGEFAAGLPAFSLRRLLDQDHNAPMLVFEGRRGTQVQLTPTPGTAPSPSSAR